MSASPSRADLGRLMAEALELAERGRFRVEPNPTVGAVVLDRAGVVAGRGFHAAWGGPHAEAVALAEAGERARGGLLVSTLEPCAHGGKKTPPCVAGIVAAGVIRVVAGAEDPNPETAGRAVRELSAAGIGYERDSLGADCDSPIAAYARHLGSDRPWVIAKWAMSLDGRIADASGAARWISGEASRGVVHAFRASADAVIVGRGTIDADDPSLTARVANSRNPLRVVIDSELSISPDANVVATAPSTPTLVLCVEGASASRRAALVGRGVEVAEVAFAGPGRVDLSAALKELRRRGVRRAFVEAGGRLTGALAREGLVDQLAVFVAPMLLGAGVSPSHGGGWAIGDAPRLERVRVAEFAGDVLVEGYLPRRTGA